MTPINRVLKEKNTTIKPIWIMRQAGRYLPEFRDIRKLNTDFIKLCLNSKLAKEITLQPLKRFDLDAAIIFSDILMLPYALNQKVEFKKNFGPILGELDLDDILNVNEDEFVQKIYPVYDAINMVSNDNLTKNKSTIGFVGAPWTLLVYMLNKQSPKLGLKKDFFENKSLIKKLLIIIEKFLKIHIKYQIENGANVIQIFDSWAGLVEEKDLQNYIYNPTLNLVKGVGQGLANFLPVNQRAIAENIGGNMGIAVDDVGRIVNTGNYQDPDNIMAGYNLNMLTDKSFDDRISNISETLVNSGEITILPASSLEISKRSLMIRSK